LRSVCDGRTEEALGDFLGGDGAAEEIALNFVAVVFAEEGHLFFVFDAFGDYQIESLKFCRSVIVGSVSEPPSGSP
jgi:hypothetical protein